MLYSDCVEHVFQQVLIMFSVVLIYGHAVVRVPTSIGARLIYVCSIQLYVCCVRRVF